jgi:hypothetical protein
MYPTEASASRACFGDENTRFSCFKVPKGARAKRT